MRLHAGDRRGAARAAATTCAASWPPPRRMPGGTGNDALASLLAVRPRLLAFWLLLTGSVLAGPHPARGVLAMRGIGALAALHAAHGAICGGSPPCRGLLRDVLVEIVRSNNAVARIILRPGAPRTCRSGFVLIPLDMRNPYGLAALACIVTATPGTVWVEYDSATQHAAARARFGRREGLGPHHQGQLGAPADGDFRMSARAALLVRPDRAGLAGGWPWAARHSACCAGRARRTASLRSIRST